MLGSQITRGLLYLNSSQGNKRFYIEQETRFNLLLVSSSSLFCHILRLMPLLAFECIHYGVKMHYFLVEYKRNADFHVNDSLLATGFNFLAFLFFIQFSMYHVLITARSTEIKAMSRGIKLTPSWTVTLTYSSLWSVIAQIYNRHHESESQLVTGNKKGKQVRFML